MKKNCDFPRGDPININRMVTNITSGKELSSGEIEQFIELVGLHELSENQIEPWLKAVHQYGLSSKETTILTKAMRDTGMVLSWPEDHHLFADKHSTGGVGDKMSIPLAPALAACGLKVPMLSGRGLGHTGGTIDKLESIPGFNTSQNPENMQGIIASVGCCIAAQSAEIAPADGLLYAIRDVTNTVDSIPLICASIISKKAAENPKSLVLDVKCGSAAFMQTESEARELATAMVETAKGLGINTLAQLTRMDHPIGTSIGNSLEIIESIEILQGKGQRDPVELIALQGGSLLQMAGLAEELQEGIQRIHNVLNDGTALEKFRQMCVAQGVEERIAEKLSKSPNLVVPLAKEITVLSVTEDGWVKNLDALSMALISRRLGAGRFTIEDVIDSGVGLVLHCEVGSYLKSGQRWVSVYHNGNLCKEDVELLRKSISLSLTEIMHQSRLIDTID